MTSHTLVPTGWSSTGAYPTSTALYPTYNGTETTGPTAYPTYTSTYTSSKIHTLSGYETTDYVTLTTTYCPGNETPSPTVTYAPKPTYTTTYKVKEVTTISGVITTKESYTTMTWCPEAPVTTVEGLQSIAPWGPGGEAHYHPTTDAHYPTTEAHYPTTTLATSPSYVGSTAVAYPTTSQIVTAGAGKAKSTVMAVGVVAAIAAMVI